MFPVNSGIASPHFFYPIIPLHRVHVNDSVHNYFSTIDFHILYTMLHFLYTIHSTSCTRSSTLCTQCSTFCTRSYYIYKQEINKR
nr:MAG TPA: hypothetical protein [Caudoviricetes sp.]DAO97989.1 MAG TPA: hypothetical protein [Caudoviricetes sp.]